jgi:hypothetical protein
MWKEKGSAHHCEGENHQFEGAKYDENNLASMKHSVCSCTPYGYKKEREKSGQDEEMNGGRVDWDWIQTIPLTDNAHSTQNTQNCVDSKPCIATLHAKSKCQGNVVKKGGPTQSQILHDE